MSRRRRWIRRNGLAGPGAAGGRFRVDVVCGWRGIANVPMPGGPGTGAGSYTVYVQMPDTLALNVNSRVRVADVFVGTRARHRAEELGRHADAEHSDKSVKLPKNATAKIGQTSLLGSQHVELAAPPDPSPQR